MKNKGFLIVTVIILIFVGLLVITSSTYVFNMYLKNEQMHSVYSQANSILNEQLRNFKNVLVYTNSNGSGYKTSGFDRRDENNNDDDYNGSIHGLDGVLDDDGDAYRYRYGVVLPDGEENVLYLDKQYMEYAYLNYIFLKKIKLFVDRSGEYSVELYDGSIYDEDKNFVLKGDKITGVFDPGENLIDISKLNPSSTDILVIFIKNNTSDMLSYKISGVGENGTELDKFMPIFDNGRNFDFYANTIIKDKDMSYLPFTRLFHNILPDGKRPVAPTNLRVLYASGSDLTLEWQVNEFSVTGSFLLYRGIDTNVKCTDQYFLKSIPNTENVYNGLFASGSFYYTICSTNVDFTGSGTLGTKGYLSTQSNVLNVQK